MSTLYDALIKHQVMLERLKTGRSSLFNKYLLEIDEELKRQLVFKSVSNIGDLNKKQIKEFIKTLKNAYSTTFNKYIAEFIRWLEAFMRADREIFSSIYSELSGLEEGPRRIAAATPFDLLWAKSLLAPLGANGMLPKVFLYSFTISATNALEREITKAWVNKATAEELIKIISGTRALKNKDGLLSKLYNQNNAVSNTLIQHFAVQANAAIASKFFDEYEWLSILDNVTTAICWARDGLRWKYGKGPLPPAHIGCRSDVCPVVDGQPMPQETFAAWLKRQGAEFKSTAPLTLEEFKSKKSVIIA